MTISRISLSVWVYGFLLWCPLSASCVWKWKCSKVMFAFNSFFSMLIIIFRVWTAWILCSILCDYWWCSMCVFSVCLSRRLLRKSCGDIFDPRMVINHTGLAVILSLGWIMQSGSLCSGYLLLLSTTFNFWRTCSQLRGLVKCCKLPSGVQVRAPENFEFGACLTCGVDACG